MRFCSDFSGCLIARRVCSKPSDSGVCMLFRKSKQLANRTWNLSNSSAYRFQLYYSAFWLAIPYQSNDFGELISSGGRPAAAVVFQRVDDCALHLINVSLLSQAEWVLL